MKAWTIFKLWLLVCAIAFGSYILLESLLEFVGVSEQYSSDISSIGLNFFELTTVVGSSLFFATLFWIIISKILEIDLEQKIIKLLLEALQLWLVILAFVVFLVINESIFSIIVKGYPFSITERPNDIIDVLWVDLMIVFLFYTVIGFQAIRKTWQYDNFIRRFIIDYGQILLISLEFALLLLPSGWLTQVNENTITFLFYYLYWSLCLSFMIEYFWWFNQQIKIRRDETGKDYSPEIFMVQILGLFAHLILFFALIPTPFYLFLTNSLIFWFILVVVLILESFGVLIYDLLAMVGVSERVAQVIENSTQPFRHKINAVMASRGAVFNYPPPTGILNGRERGGTPIDSRQRKVTLKIACGQCYHVFIVKTVKKGSKIPSFPCPICGSLATTPVWE